MVQLEALLKPHVESRAFFRIGGVKLTAEEAALVNRLRQSAEEPPWLPCELVKAGGVDSVAPGVPVLVRAWRGRVELEPVEGEGGGEGDDFANADDDVRDAVDLTPGSTVAFAPRSASVVELRVSDRAARGDAPIRLACKRPHVLLALVGAELGVSS